MLLSMPLAIVSALPGLLDLVNGVPAEARTAATTASASAFRLIAATPTAARKFAPLDEAPPPTLAPPVATPAAVATALPAGTGERIAIGNTGGRGAVLRAEPVTGTPVAALRDGQLLDVLERRPVNGGEWVHARTADGHEGWVTALVSQKAP